MKSWNLETPNKTFDESYETAWTRRFLDPEVQYRWTIPGNYISERPNIPVPLITTITSLSMTTSSLTIASTSVNIPSNGVITVYTNTSNTPAGAVSAGTLTATQLLNGFTFSGTFSDTVTYYVFFGYLENFLVPVPSNNSVSVPPLYTFSTFTFTNVGITGRNGPTYSQTQSAYGSGSNWWNNTSYFNMTVQGIQLWTVPKTGTYEIIAAGAGKGQSGAGGAIVSTNYSFTRGSIIKILVGQMTGVVNFDWGAAGGTFIALNDNTPILVAGGSAGNGSNATLTPDLITTQGSTNGGGFYYNGVSALAHTVPLSFINGGVGGDEPGGGKTAGFGGGGSGSGLAGLIYGGGGGYNGGSYSYAATATGGTSYDINGTNKVATRYTQTINGEINGYNSGNGFVRITLIN